MIGVDWGTSSLRAWRLGADGAIIAGRTSPRGIMTVAERGFEPVLREIAGDWLAEGEDRILMCGMIGSRQGWQEAPYLKCPAGIEAIAASLTPVAFAGARVMIVPGLVCDDEDGVPDVMRGEETQILGIGGDAHSLVCLPGTHSKWARVADRRIDGFDTYMTGEVFAALAGHTILERTVEPGPIDGAAFAEGLVRATRAGGLLHHAFGVRTRVLRLGVDEGAAYGYLSGLLIGHELNAALGRAPGAVAVVGASALAGLYATAIETRGGVAVLADETACAVGLAELGARASWI